MNFRYLVFFLNLIKSIFKKPLNIYRPILYLFYKFTGQITVVYKAPMLRGQKIVLDLNSHFDRSIFFSGLMGKHMHIDFLKFLLKNLKKDSIFFDIGSNSGYFSFFASQIANKGLIHSFEPVPHTYKNFLKTIRLNDIQNIKVNNVCVGNKNKMIEFYESFHSDVSGTKVTQYQKGNKIIKSRMITLVNYCKENKVRKMDILKIDTEGGEKDIIFSSGDLIKRYRPIIIIEFCDKTAKPFGYHPNEVYDFLMNLGYAAYKWNGKNLITQRKKGNWVDEDIYFIYKNNL